MLRLVKGVLVLSFVIMLCLPMLQFWRPFAVIKPLNENRFKTSMPDNPASLFSLGSEYATKFEAFFNDHYGFRDFLIRLKNQMDYSLWGRSSEIIIGKDGWLFYKSVVERDLVEPERASREDFNRLFSRLIRLNDYLKSRGIRLIIVPIPNKNTIYSEYIPEGTANRPIPTAFDRYTHFLSLQTEIEYVDAKAILEKLKNSQPVFHRTDFHWNDPAGFSVAEKIVNRIGQLLRRGRVWTHPVGIKIVKGFSGTQNDALGVFWPPLEAALMLSDDIPQAPGTYQEIGQNEWVFFAGNPTDPALLPLTVIIGDSFSDAFLRAGSARYFSELRKYHCRNFKTDFPNITSEVRIVVLEHIETGLNSLLSNEYWPESLR